MVTAVDSSVLLDVLLDDPGHAASSEAALVKARSEGLLVLGEAVLAEISPLFRDSAECVEFMRDWQLEFVPSNEKSALLAGDHFRTFLQRGGKRGRVVADFLVAAHAQEISDRLLARDRGYYRDYFKQLTLWDPSPESAGTPA